MLNIFKDRVVVGCLVATVILCLWFQVHLATGTQLIVLRNAFLADMGQPADFAWKPNALPAAFSDDSDAIPPYATDIVRPLGTAGLDRFDATVVIARHLLRHRSDGYSIRSDTLSTYRRIVGDGGGYCADYTQVFTALALAAGIPVREWGFARGDFGGGHAFNEIYSDIHRQWIFVDVFSGFYLSDKRTNKLLSVEELRLALKENRFGDMEFIRFNPDIFRFHDTAQAWDFYQSGADQFYLWWGNDIFAYEANPAVDAAGKFARLLKQVTAMVLGLHPRFRVLPGQQNEEAWRQLMSLKYQLIFIICSFLVIAMVMLWRIVNKRRHTPTAPLASRPVNT